MSETRSRDVNAPGGPSYDYDKHDEHLHRKYHGKEYRAVEWPEGAPPRSEVPHAGEKVMWAREVVEVLSGIPFVCSAGSWSLHVRSAHNSAVAYLPAVSSLTPIPTKPETVTVNKAELRALRERLDELENQ